MNPLSVMMLGLHFCQCSCEMDNAAVLMVRPYERRNTLRYFPAPMPGLSRRCFAHFAILYFDDEAQYAWKGSVVDRQGLEQDQEILLELRKDLLRFAELPDDFALEFAEGKEQYFAKIEDEEV